MSDVTKNTLLTFKGICINFLLELKFFILSHPVTSKQPHKIVQIHMGHPVNLMARAWNSATELQTATTLGAAKSAARKWACNLINT